MRHGIYGGARGMVRGGLALITYTAVSGAVFDALTTQRRRRRTRRHGLRATLS